MLGVGTDLRVQIKGFGGGLGTLGCRLLALGLGPVGSGRLEGGLRNSLHD